MIILFKLKIYFVMIFFTLIHELFHGLVGICLKEKIDSIKIKPYGFNLKFKINYNDYNKKIKKASLISIKRIIIYSAGPIVNLLIFFIFLIGKMNINIKILSLEITNEEILYSNLILAIFNMLPIYPLDGGRIVQELVHIFSGLRKSYKITQDVTWVTISIFTAFISILVLYYKNIVLLIVLIYLWIITIRTEREFLLKEKIYQRVEKNIRISRKRS